MLLLGDGDLAVGASHIPLFPQLLDDAVHRAGVAADVAADLRAGLEDADGPLLVGLAAVAVDGVEEAEIAGPRQQGVVDVA